MTPTLPVSAIAPGLADLRVPIESLHPYSRNPRRGNLEAIKASLLAHGQYRPLVARKGSGEVLAGNHTLAAALELGWDSIAATFIEVDDEQAARIVLVDNRTADLGVYDDGELAALLQSLPGLDGTGWDENELARLVAQLQSGDDRDTPPGPPPAEPIARLGDLWQLGRHRLLCGDATDPAAVERLLGGAKPKLLATDPPYGVSLDMEWRDLAGFNNARFLGTKDRRDGYVAPAEPSYLRSRQGNRSISGDDRADWSEAFALVPSLRVAYVWFADPYCLTVGAGLERLGFELAQLIVWDKQRMVLSRTHYHSQHEPCWYARRKGAGRFLGPRNQTTVWSHPSPKMNSTGSEPDDEREDHPTQKPVELFARPMRNHLGRRDSFYEPFCGSGTALVAGENVGRQGFALEIDPVYCDVIVDRWQRHTGGKAEVEHAAL
jgi:DNA modification methylase